jgi:ABC-type transport system involved in cytochrome c biogenesis permease subunit
MRTLRNGFERYTDPMVFERMVVKVGVPSGRQKLKIAFGAVALLITSNIGVTHMPDWFLSWGRLVRVALMLGTAAAAIHGATGQRRIALLRIMTFWFVASSLPMAIAGMLSLPSGPSPSWCLGTLISGYTVVSTAFGLFHVVVVMARMRHSASNVQESN